MHSLLHCIEFRYGEPYIRRHIELQIVPFREHSYRYLNKNRLTRLLSEILSEENMSHMAMYPTTQYHRLYLMEFEYKEATSRSNGSLFR